MRRSESEWLAIIEGQAQSGVTAQEFCDRHSISYNSFAKWRRRLRNADPLIEPQLLELAQIPAASAPGSCVASVVELHICDSIRLRIEIGR